MAYTISAFLAFLLLFTTLSSPLVSCRRRNLYARPTTFSYLDVATSLHQARHLSTLTDHSKDTIFPSFASSSDAFFSLELHPRDSLFNSTDKNYKSLLLKRLARDTARITSLQARLSLALGMSDRDVDADTGPPDEGDEASALQAPSVSGLSLGSGEYFSRIAIGHPPRPLYVVIDTGSDISWVQCQPCSECYSQSDPIFDPSTSSSFRSLTCSAPECRALDVSECRSNDENCLYEVSYGDGSYTVGDFMKESLTFDGGDSVENVAIGCGHSNEGLFIGAGGLLGLGGGVLSLPSQMNSSSFSYCLVDRDSNSVSTIEFNIPGTSPSPPHAPQPSPSQDAAITAPLIKNRQLDTFYYLGLTSILVGGQRLELPVTAFQIDNDGNGGVIIDSGTAVTRLDQAVYEAMRDEFRVGASHLPNAESLAIFDTCYNLTGMSSVRVPAVELEFTGGQRLVLPAKNFLIPVDTEGTFCFAFAGTTSSMSIIGNVQQQGTRVRFDLDNEAVTFEPNRC